MRCPTCRAIPAIVLIASTLGAQTPTMPLARIAVAEGEKMAESSPSTLDIRAAIAAKRRQAEATLQPYDSVFKPRRAPANDTEKAQRETFDKKAFALRDSLVKALEAFVLTQRAPMREALAKGIAPTATAARLDYVFDRNAVPSLVNGSVATERLSKGEAPVGEMVVGCRLLRLDLEPMLTRTAPGKKMAADMAKQRTTIEGEFQAKLTTQRAAEMKWEEAQRRSVSTLTFAIAQQVKRVAKVEDRICIVDHKSLAANAAVLYESKAGSAAKLPDATEWVASNLDGWIRAEEQLASAARMKELARRDTISEWVDRTGAAMESLRGAVDSVVPAGWTKAWKSTKPFLQYRDVLVGTDAAGKWRARVIIARGLDQTDAGWYYDTIVEELHKWSTPLPWMAVEIPEEVLRAGLKSAEIWGRPADGKISTKIWESEEAMKLRGPGTILVTLEPDGAKFKVVLEIAEAIVPPPTKK